MAAYTTRDVARLTGLPPQRVRQLVRDGWVRVDRDPRGALRFDVQAIGRLKRAHALVRQVPRGRLRQALERLGGAPDLDRIEVLGGELVVRDGPARWEARTGQLTLDLDGGAHPELAELPPPGPAPVRTEAWTAEDWFDLGCDLDGYDDARARDAYRRALGLDPAHVDAKVALAHLVCAHGDPHAAVALLEEALAQDPGHAQAWFELGVAREREGEDRAALAAYAEALAADEWLAEAHLQAAGVCRRLGRGEDAARHLETYESLTGS
jgi:tetratricopeptide (TPR) repeat protein